MDCIFCKINDGSINSYTIYEDELVRVFLDINPSSTGHCLVIPKKHFLDITDIDLEYLNQIFTIIKTIRKRLEDRLHINGLTLIQNNGDVEEVKHFHIHLKPYYINDPKLSLDQVFELLKD